MSNVTVIEIAKIVADVWNIPESWLLSPAPSADTRREPDSHIKPVGKCAGVAAYLASIHTPHPRKHIARFLGLRRPDSLFRVADTIPTIARRYDGIKHALEICEDRIEALHEARMAESELSEFDQLVQEATECHG